VTPTAGHDPLQNPAGTRPERLLLALLLGAMILLPAAATVSRRLLGVELLGTSVLTQHLTLWVGFLGGLLAAASDHHLALATLDLLPDGVLRRSGHLLRQSIAAATCALLAWGSVLLVRAEAGSLSTVAFGIRVAWSQLVMPVGFAAMALRFAWRAGQGPWRWPARATALVAAGGAFLLGQLLPGPGLTTTLVLVAGGAFLIGAPVFVGMAGIAMALFFRDAGPSGIAAIPVATFQLASSETLPAIPLLTVAGYVLAEGGAGRRLVRAYKGFFGWMPGGVAVMVAFVCALFTTFTGGSGVTILALGGLVLPMLLEEGYPEGFSLGLVTAAGSLGLLFPPSLPVILYGVVAQAPIDHLFLGGLLPGLLMIGLVATYGVVVGIRARAPRQRFVARDALRALWEAKWDLGLPTLVIVAVGSGTATIVESAALAAAYSLVVEVLIFREIRPVHGVQRIFASAATLVGAVVLLLGAAMGLTSWFVDAEIPSRLVEWMTGHVQSPALFLLMLNVVLLVLGSVLEIYSAIVVLAPLVAPLGRAYGIDPVHLGVVFLANLELGFLFPPMGLNLFLSASRFQRPLPTLYRQALPFLLIMTAGVLAITYLPALTTGVVHLLVH
jgi:C4-dicarboxylate transporter, DctM subunit